MPSSPFTSEAERLRAREAMVNVLAHGSAHGTTSVFLDDALLLSFDRLYPAVDAPDGWRSDHSAVGEAIKARRKPTPPDFDAALDDLETRASLYHSSGGPNRTHYRNDLTAVRQRVRELHEAVVRERDDWRQNYSELNAQHTDQAHVCAALRARVAALTAERDALVPLARWGMLAYEGAEQGQPLTEADYPSAAEQLGIDLTTARAALLALYREPVGEEYEVAAMSDGCVSMPVVLLTGPQFDIGDWVRVSKVEGV